MTKFLILTSQIFVFRPFLEAALIYLKWFLRVKTFKQTNQNLFLDVLNEYDFREYPKIILKLTAKGLNLQSFYEN